jgi:hypothetical protein
VTPIKSLFYRIFYVVIKALKNGKDLSANDDRSVSIIHDVLSSLSLPVVTASSNKWIMMMMVVEL